jgi:hypothetical protein
MDTLDEEVEDLVTCTVCMLEYDHDERKPKYLQCHHVLCLQCLTVNLKQKFKIKSYWNEICSENRAKNVHHLPDLSD